MQRVAVIMAGGSGERFWPLSRRNQPKQLLALSRPDQTMLEEAVERIAPLIPREHVYIQTAAHLADAVKAAGLNLPQQNIIAEPCKRNTAGCLSYAVAHMVAQYGGAPVSMAVLTADHLIGDEALFRKTIDLALRTGEEESVLVTLGVAPDYPSTGYGYIHAGAALERMGAGVRLVQRFQEKPALETAQEYVASGEYFWNSGMFFWTTEAFLREADGACPVFSGAARAMAAAMAANDAAAVRTAFEALPSISIDYALMEKASRVAMVRAEFPWDDLGTWAALERTRTPDAAGNVTQGDPVLIDARGCIVYNAPGAAKMSVALVGVEDLVVITTADAVLVVPKHRTEEVKRAVEALAQGDAHTL